MSKTAPCCLAIIGSQCFQGFISSLPASSFPSVAQLLSLMSSFDLQFSTESFICCCGHPVDLIFTQGLCSLPLSLPSQSKSVWSVVGVARVCRLCKSVMTLTALLSSLSGTWCLLPSLLTFMFSLTLLFLLYSPLQLLLIAFPGTQLLFPSLSSLAPVIPSLPVLAVS